MHKFIDKIKKLEGKPFVVKEFLNANEVNLFQTLYKQLPIEIDNKRQKILKLLLANLFQIKVVHKYCVGVLSNLLEFQNISDLCTKF